MQKQNLPSVRTCLLLLILSTVWLLLGAPLTPDQWRSAPLELRQSMLQLPVRMHYIFSRWYGTGLFSSAQAEAISTPILRVWNTEQRRVQLLPLEEYVQCALAAEMPAHYDPQALRCQAVTARTYALHASLLYGGNGCDTVASCDVCTNSSCCQAYADKELQQSQWGAEYSLFHKRTSDAVHATEGLILTYEGLPALPLYHACSGGLTENVQEVFSQSLPYLISVESPGEEAASTYSDHVVYTLEEACTRLRSAFPECGVEPDSLASQLRLQTATSSGRVGTVLIGSALVSGRELRAALDLRSTYITWEADNRTITFRTKGYGHGVGMSQVGAQAMAAEGYSFAEIL